MANIALCWELGGGAGHLIKLLEFATAAQVEGHRVHLISRDLCLAGNMPGFANCELYQAPITPRQGFAEPIINYSGVLRSCGYQSQAVLATSLAAWSRLLELINADLVIVEHAPTAVLAARCLGLSIVMTGTGFDAPPLEEPMPSMVPWLSPDPAELGRADARVLGTINAVLPASIPKFSAMHEVFAPAKQWIFSVPELEHYQRANPEFVTTESKPFDAEPPKWPKLLTNNDKENRIFVYFDANSHHLTELLQQLHALRVPVAAVIPGVAESVKKAVEGTNINLLEHRVNLQQVVNHCDLVVCHGGHATVLDLLRLGKPAIILPDTLERTLLAYRAGKAGLAFSGTAEPGKINLQEMIKVARRTTLVWDHAKAFQQRWLTQQTIPNAATRLQPLLAELG